MIWLLTPIIFIVIIVLFNVLSEFFDEIVTWIVALLMLGGLLLMSYNISMKLLEWIR